MQALMLTGVSSLAVSLDNTQTKPCLLLDTIVAADWVIGYTLEYDDCPAHTEFILQE